MRATLIRISDVVWLSGLILAIHANLSCVVIGQETDTSAEQKEEANVEMLECKVKVVDPDGHPVEEATVFCTGLRSKEEQGSHWGWSAEEFGPLPRIKTNADGIAVMPYPKMLGEDQTTGQMTWSVEHPDFVNYRQDHPVDDDPAEIGLERGFRIALTAKSASAGEVLKEKLHAVVSFAGGGKWELKKNGMLVSGTMKNQNGILRVACFEEGKPTLFSKEVDVKPGDKSRVLLKGIELSPGCRIEGKIDDSTPRPIRNGYVIACIYKEGDRGVQRSTWRWADEAKIAEDGTFVFESLPRGEAVQLLPICDGSVPAKPKPEDVLAVLQTDNPDQVKRMIEVFDATPQIVKAEGDVVTTTLMMTKAPSVTVKVVDQNDEPIENVRVATNSNQYWFNAGSQILGSSYSTRHLWEMEQPGEDINRHFVEFGHPYMKRTDKDGVVCLKNMPKGKHVIGIYEKEWEMEKDPMSGEPQRRVSVNEEDLLLTIKLFPKGTAPEDSEESSGEKNE